MLALKYSHQLSWGELKFIEDPMHAIRTVESEHGRRIGGKSIENAHLHDLPNGDDKRFDPYRFLKTKLERGDVFLVNRSTLAPAVTSLEIDADGNPEYTLRHSTSQYFHSAFRSALRHIPVPKPMGVLRDEPKPAQAKQEQTKVEREKHVILLNLEGQNDRPLPLKHNITLYVENTTQGTTAARQLSEVIYNPYSKVFSTEKGDGLKVYAIPDSLLEVRKDLNKNKNLADSESKDLIKALTETGQETRADGAILHHFDYIVPVPLSLNVGYEFGSKLNKGAVLILQHEDSEWTQSIHLSAGPKERRVEDGVRGWVNVNFENLPESGKFSLILHHNNDGSSDVSFFSGVSVDDLPKLFQFESLPLTDLMPIPEEDLEWFNAAKQQDDWLKEIST